MNKKFVFIALLLSTATFIKAAGAGSDGIDFKTGQKSADRLNELYYSVVNKINRKDFKQAQQLIEHNLDSGIIHWTVNGKNFLHHAALSGNLDFVNFLLDHGANLNVQAPSKVTPLMVAASNNQNNIVNAFLSRGADDSLKDAFNLTAFLLAVQSGALESVQTFIEFYRNQEKTEPLDIKAAIIVAQRATEDIVNYLRSIN